MQYVLMLALRLGSNHRPGPQAEPPPPCAHKAGQRLLLVAEEICWPVQVLQYAALPAGKSVVINTLWTNQ